MSFSPARCYSEKGVQTEPQWYMEPAVSELDSCRKRISAGLINKHAGCNSSERDSEMSHPTHPTSRVTGKPWLEYNRPSCVSYDACHRVVSLPEFSLGECQEHAKGNPRVVSMPELMSQTATGHHDPQNLVRNLEGQLSFGRGYPLDLPQTPSPPSSPDSLIIVDSRALQQDEVESVWNWANSPPRPIPALHGPSSLPYARCPSGAEGTVMEGGDLTHKVWGLVNASDGPHPKSPFNDYGDVEASAAPSPQFPRYSVAGYSNTSKVPKARTVKHSTSADTTCPGHAESYIDLANLSLYTARSGREDRTARVENKFQNTTLHNSLFDHSGTRRLRSMAPAFIPTNYVAHYESGEAHTQPNTNPGYVYEELYKRWQQLNPGTLMERDRTSSGRKTFHPTDSYAPQIYSPQTDLGGHWNEFIIQPEFFSTEDRLLVDPIYPLERIYTPACATDRPTFPTIALSGLSNEANSDVNLPQTSGYPTPSVITRRDLPYQQPMPLARSIQRRLSAVVEEDIGNSRSHLMSTTLVNTNPSIPSPSSNTAKIKNRLQTTDNTASVMRRPSNSHV